MRKLFGLIAVLAAGAGSLAAQSQAQSEPPAQGPTFRTGVEVIAVDVSVVDGNGRPVEDLLAPDFVVEDRRTTAAGRIGRSLPHRCRGGAAGGCGSLRIAVHHQPEALERPHVRHRGRPARDQVRGARGLLETAGKFLDTLSPADRTAFVAYPEPGIQVGFTSDKLRLRQAMQRTIGRQQLFSGKFNIGLYEAIAISEKGDGRIFAQVTLRECPRLIGTALEQCERDVLSESSSLVRSVRQDTTESLRGLTDLLLGLSVIEGPKTLILLSEGMVLESPSDLDPVIRAAAYARVSIHVLLLDVPRHDITVARLQPTPTEDRDMQVQGLGDLAAATRGALYYIAGTGQNVFDRLGSETLAYYMLGVEQSPSDRDGKQHRIDVEVRRRNVTVRSRRAFVLSSPTTTRRNAEETLMDALKSPFGVAEVPVRLTTFTQKDPASDKARIIIAAEVGQPGGEPAEYTVGYVLLDDEGKVVSGTADKRTLSVPDGLETSPRDYLTEVIVDPGNYSLRFGVVDAEGRRGGIIRDVNAWKLGGEEFAVGDLLIGDTGTRRKSQNQAWRRAAHPGQRGRVPGDVLHDPGIARNCHRQPRDCRRAGRACITHGTGRGPFGG